MPLQILVENFGGPEVLRLKEVASIPLTSGQLRVKTKAVGVNRADIMVRTGNYHLKTTPITPGLEASGIVIESKGQIPVGSPVLVFRKMIGLYSSELVVSEDEVIGLPPEFDLETAASLPVNWLSAYHSLFRLMKLLPGETLLISAASSAVGQAAIQLALNIGARVLAGVGSPEKMGWLQKKYPAAEVFHYSHENLSSKILELTKSKGVEAALDLVGGAHFRPVLLSLRAGGRMVQCANVSLADSQINVRDFYSKNISIHGFQYGNLIALGRDTFREDLPKIIDGFQQKKYQSLVTETFLLKNADEAHRKLESRSHIGKIILKTGDQI